MSSKEEIKNRKLIGAFKHSSVRLSNLFSIHRIETIYCLTKIKMKTVFMAA